MPAPTPTPGESPAPGAGRDRGDACPGALRLHSADDGSLARVRLPGGLLTVRQADELAALAEELGDGHLDLTSRGNVQLRGLAATCGAGLGERLRGAGLLPSDRHERVRNVVASPLSGLDGNGRADTRTWARALDALLCADPAVTALSGRFLFGLDDGRGDIAALAPDVTLIAADEGGDAVLGYGDGPHGLRIPAADAPRAALLAALHFLDAVRRHGTGSWRVRELPDREPLDRDGAALAGRLAAAGIPAAPAQLPPGTAPRPPAPGPVPGPDGRTALSVGAPLGRLTVAQWRLLARTAAEHGDGELRVTPWRGLVVPGLAAAHAGDRLAALAAAGLVTDPASPWHRAGACAGRPGCAKSRADVRADAGAALAGARPPRTETLPVYWSGCERRCGRPGGGRWVDVLATDDGYRVAVRDEGRDEGWGEGRDESRETPDPVRPVAPDGLTAAVAAARTSTPDDPTTRRPTTRHPTTRPRRRDDATT
ncbi:precorrin-3B synthase [Streptomyces sp. AV19]|uniref:precorrin-3B synthase n=1 Tax=Streptomyces sp. AV19 TaxID=2793068 RepID=UPI001F4339C8|nr:precorrin-3B synthase [Streptomyces sp. AV19]MDG4534677.1 precorrin-3B synthase [Streptomyces sp. AV19]